MIILAGLFLIGFNYLFAQEIPQPDFANVPVYYIEGTNVLHNLAKENVAIVGKMTSATYELQGQSSKVKIKQTDDYVFIIKPLADIDPTTMVQLKKMKVTKKSRQASLAKLQGLKTLNSSIDNISYNLKKLGDNVYQIVPETKLEVGEYMFIVGNVAYSFAIE
jgi:hypothetical protein